ncbi:MAG TPA: hypothetical protein VGH20_06395 [Myxococcales bacterium]|jgi:hypothetical protein
MLKWIGMLGLAYYGGTWLFDHPRVACGIAFAALAAIALWIEHIQELLIDNSISLTKIVPKIPDELERER